MRVRALALLGVLLVLLPAAPAAAEDHPLELSRDGVRWSAQMAGGLFESPVRWVPGDRRVVTFYARNSGPTSADLVLALVSADPDRLFADRHVTVTARVGAGSWVTLDTLGAGFRLNDEVLPVRTARRVEVAVTLDAFAPGEVQDRSLPLDFQLVLVDAGIRDGSASSGSGSGSTVGGGSGGGTGGPGSGPGGGGGTGDGNSAGGPGDGSPDGPGDGQGGAGSVVPPGLLPATGAPAVGATLLAAGALIGIGLALLMARRRRDDEETPDGTA